MSALPLVAAASLILLGAEPVVPAAGVPDEIVESVRADLARRTGAAPGAMKVARAEEVVFADGSLDCPVPGQAYTQVTVPGYRVILELGGRKYDYRVTRRGSLRLCDRAARPR